MPLLQVRSTIRNAPRQSCNRRAAGAVTEWTSSNCARRQAYVRHLDTSAQYGAWDSEGKRPIVSYARKYKQVNMRMGERTSATDSIASRSRSSHSVGRLIKAILQCSDGDCDTTHVTIRCHVLFTRDCWCCGEIAGTTCQASNNRGVYWSFQGLPRQKTRSVAICYHERPCLSVFAQRSSTF